ncbi:ferredoxin domain-containing protein [Desulfallas thermosapovorans]|uniref:Putative ferredoxin-like protein n=1 Tax=Desulfallas thermosapovorans DSM 6562 TaxID=1121431 RepID=A0A5S4ZWY5_9FIRM|nr:DUF2148 domain-containing protein [Desulfallas thermosapovorans]TYO97329.1 putative ferredoxin-like protein [Desulfallas thermosapovorans DSM 6562]
MSGIMHTVAELMAVSARTAPKCLGQDYLDIQVLSGDDLQRLADEMDKFGRETGKVNFDRDAENIRHSEAVLFVSLRENVPLGLDCGACGHEQCAQLESRQGPDFLGPLCAWRVMDLGIALGSAAKTAGILNVDNRVMYRPAVVAKKMGLVKGAIVCAIPISATSKNIYFDRPVK